MIYISICASLWSLRIPALTVKNFG